VSLKWRPAWGKGRALPRVFAEKTAGIQIILIRYENNLYQLSTEGSENGGDAFTAFSAMSHTCFFTGMTDRDPSTNLATPTALLALLCQECVSK